MKQEIVALEKNGTWKIMELPPGKHAIRCKWVFKIKYKDNGEIDRFEARLVAKGYSHTEVLSIMRPFHQLWKWSL